MLVVTIVLPLCYTISDTNHFITIRSKVPSLSRPGLLSFKVKQGVICKLQRSMMKSVHSAQISWF